MRVESDFASCRYLKQAIERVNSEGLVKQFLRFVDLGGKIRASASVWVVEEHQLSVVFANFILGQGSLSI